MYQRKSYKDVHSRYSCVQYYGGKVMEKVSEIINLLHVRTSLCRGWASASLFCLSHCVALANERKVSELGTDESGFFEWVTAMGWSEWVNEWVNPNRVSTCISEWVIREKDKLGRWERIGADLSSGQSMKKAPSILFWGPPLRLLLDRSQRSCYPAQERMSIETPGYQTIAPEREKPESHDSIATGRRGNVHVHCVLEAFEERYRMTTKGSTSHE